MKKRIAIIGSRKLACDVLNWVKNSSKVEIVGGFPPPFNGWWQDEFKATLEDNKIPVFNDLDLLLNEKIDVVFSINFWKKIEAKQINRVKVGIINIHHSYLLKYKGRYSTSWAIVNARKLNCWEHGSTLHYIDEKLDEGKIIDSWKCMITEDDTAETLFDKVEKLSFLMFKKNFDKMLMPVTEFLRPAEECFFYDKDSNNLEIPLKSSPEDIYDFVRAWSFKDRPKPFFVVNGRRIYMSL